MAKTTISIEETTRDRLAAQILRKGETYDEIVNRALNALEKRGD
jgi:hypothetical protein